eukprot:8770817-Pyramimonas_sp.AAC.1
MNAGAIDQSNLTWARATVQAPRKSLHAVSEPPDVQIVDGVAERTQTRPKRSGNLRKRYAMRPMSIPHP